MNIGSRLRELRQRKALSQLEVANRIGMSRPHLSKLENDDVVPTLTMLERLAKALDVEIRQLLPTGYGSAAPPQMEERILMGTHERTILVLFRQMPVEDKSWLISFAREMIRQKRKRE